MASQSGKKAWLEIANYRLQITINKQITNNKQKIKNTNKKTKGKAKRKNEQNALLIRV